MRKASQLSALSGLSLMEMELSKTTGEEELAAVAGVQQLAAARQESEKLQGSVESAIADAENRRLTSEAGETHRGLEARTKTAEEAMRTMQSMMREVQAEKGAAFEQMSATLEKQRKADEARQRRRRCRPAAAAAAALSRG